MWLSYLTRRAIALVATLVVASAIVFLAVSLGPGDPAILLSGTTRPTPETLAAVRAEYHLDDPVWVRYVFWVGGVFSGDLGRSFVFDTEVATLVLPRIGRTLFLVAYSGTIIVVVGVALGVWAALRPRAGRWILLSTAFLLGAPSFVVATLLVWLFATGLGFFPVYGSGEGFLDMLWHLTLPAFSLSVAYLAYVSRITRVAVAAETGSEHVQTALVRGIPSSLIVRRHVLRNAAAPILTVSGLTVAGLFAASVVIEEAFALDGIGSLMVSSAAAKDIPVVQAIVLAIVAMFVIVTTLIDIINAILDPRLLSGGASR